MKKLTQILNIFLIIFFINGCSLLSSFARENPNERYNEEGEDLVTNSETEDLEISNDYPYPSIENNPLSQSELPRPKKIFSSGNSEKVEIRRLNQTADKPIPLRLKLSPNVERANKSIKNRKKEKAKTTCEPDLNINRNSNRRIFSIAIDCPYTYLG